MLEKKDHVKRIQEITFEAYKSSGRIAAIVSSNTISRPPAKRGCLKKFLRHPLWFMIF